MPSEANPTLFTLTVVMLLTGMLLPVVAGAGAADAPSEVATTQVRPDPVQDLLQQAANGTLPDTVHYTVEAHDGGPESSEYWFTSNKTGAEHNPVLFFPRGAHVVVEFVNEGDQAHNFHVGDPIQAQTNILGNGESETLEFDVPEDAQATSTYWCDPHITMGMQGTFATTAEAFQRLNTEHVTVEAHDGGAESSTYWFTTNQTEVEPPEGTSTPLLLLPGKTYNITFVNEGDQIHNLHIGGPIAEATPILDPGQQAFLEFTVPANVTEYEATDLSEEEQEVLGEEGAFLYWCDPHRDIGMFGPVYVNQTAWEEALGELGGEEHLDIESLGVNYLAYWVGVISFALLMIVYGAYYFVFKHGESFINTDQKDRPGNQVDAEEARKGHLVGLGAFVLTLAVVALLTAWTQGYLG